MGGKTISHCRENQFASFSVAGFPSRDSWRVEEQQLEPSESQGSDTQQL